MDGTDLLNRKVVDSLTGRNLQVTLFDGRSLVGHLYVVDLGISSVTLSLEDNGVLTTHRFPVSMIRNVQTR